MSTRLSRLRKLLKQNKLDAVLISTLSNIIYLTDFDHFYDEEREAFLLITQKSSYILTDKRYTHAVQEHVRGFTLRELFYGNGLAETMKDLAKQENIEILGVEDDDMSFSEYKKIAPFFKEIYNLDLSSYRTIKSAKEIRILQKACAISDAAYNHILTFIKEGMTEKEVANEMEIFIKQQGAELSFPTIIAFGENGAFIHHRTSDRQLRKGDSILIDFGAKYQNYCSDVGRTVFFGTATEEKKKAYHAVIQAQKKVIEYIQTKLNRKQTLSQPACDTPARNYLMKRGYESFPHGLGHGIGLQVHELPHLRPPATGTITGGMVFTIEPGVYKKGVFGIRVEDDFVIKDNKLIQLTKSTRELIEL